MMRLAVGNLAVVVARGGLLGREVAITKKKNPNKQHKKKKTKN